MLEKLETIGVKALKLISISDKDMVIKMEYIDGKKLSEHLNKTNMADICPKIGTIIAKLHANNIIHGDLTTSNMLLLKDEVYLIDFGLSFHSTKIEDKAVDLHLMKQALKSRHHSIWQHCFGLIASEYKKHYEDSEMVLKRLEKVEQRGRYK
ncbi:Kae1-associated kinase Bud32 [Candidatus Woesearchaeota archaeon]|nr:MAG: Kae1-associated kinase Bud32 [Candidatus Woesearchaeota archaeon]